MLDCSTEFKYDDRILKGGFSVYNIGAQLETETKALREVDQETQKYVAQSRRLCDEYNKCILDRETYATRAENLRRRMDKVPEMLDGLQQASTATARAKAVAVAYQALVPDEQRVELGLDFSVMAARPSEPAPVAIRPGTALATGTRVTFTVRTTRPAHVYLFQRSPDGSVNVLFPDARMNLANPLAADQPVQIPPQGAFRLNDKDIGEEKVFLAASLQPLASLQQAAGALIAGQTKIAVLESLSSLAPGGASGSCRTRALEFDPGTSPACVRTRALELDASDGSGGQPSLRLRTEAADSTIVGVFSFQHTR
jgi:hypothetical protein